MGHMIITLATIAFGVALTVLVVVVLTFNSLREWRGAPGLSASAAARLTAVITLLSLAFGSSLAVTGIMTLRSGDASPMEGWPELLVGCSIIATQSLVWYAGRHNPALLYRRSPPSSTLPVEIDGRLARREEVEAVLGRGDRIKAIRLYREDTGAGLAEAKRAVDALAEHLEHGARS